MLPILLGFTLPTGLAAIVDSLRDTALLVPKRPVAVRPVLVAVALPVEEAAVVDLTGASRGANRDWLRRCLRVRREARALSLLIRPVAVRPVLVAAALSINEATVVHIRRRAAGGLRGCLSLCLPRRVAMAILIRPIAVGPVFVSLALSVNETTIVDWCYRFNWTAVRNSGMAYPTCHPYITAIPVDLEPTVDTADHLQNGASWR